MSKILKVIIVVILLFFGFLFGMISTKITYASDNASIINSEKIVFINNDQRKNYNDKNYNFGNIEINKLKNVDEYKRNKIEIVNALEANHGLDSGDYGAAITIPSNFTESILSINDDITSTSTITYEISDTLSKENKNKMLQVVNSIIDSIKGDISYMYVYAIFDSLHTSQSGVNTVISNMRSVYDFMSSLESIDVFNKYDYEIKEYEDQDLSEVDLTDEEKEYVDTINEYVEKIDDSVVRMEEDIKISNTDFIDYLIDTNENLDTQMENLEEQMLSYENFVSDEMDKIEENTNKLNSIDLQPELKLINNISKNEINKLNSLLSVEFDQEDRELKDLLELNTNINDLTGLSLNFNGEIKRIQDNAQIIHDKNEELMGLDFTKNISSYLETTNKLEECLENEKNKDCLNDNFKDLDELNLSINEEIDSFQNKLNSKYKNIESEINKTTKDGNYNKENIKKEIKIVDKDTVLSIYNDISNAYLEIKKDINSLIDNNSQFKKGYDDIKETLDNYSSLSNEEINKINTIVSKDEGDINTNDLNEIESICYGKYDSEISCSIIKNYIDTKDKVLSVTNALEPEKNKVIDNKVEYLNGTCANPMSIAYVYEGWNCIENNTLTHYRGINKKESNQTDKINTISDSLSNLEVISQGSLDDIGKIISNISAIEIELDKYEEVDYKKVDSSPYKKNIRQISKNVKEESAEVEDRNNEIYAGMDENYQKNFDSYQKYIENVSNDTTYEDMIKGFEGEEDKRQEKNLIYLKELTNLMPNSSTKGLPNKNIYNHIADPLSYINMETNNDTNNIKKSESNINWFYVFIILILLIGIVVVIIVLKKVD